MPKRRGSSCTVLYRFVPSYSVVYRVSMRKNVWICNVLQCLPVLCNLYGVKDFIPLWRHIQARFGTVRSEVRILLPRLDSSPLLNAV